MTLDHFVGRHEPVEELVTFIRSCTRDVPVSIPVTLAYAP
jgi:hypothetical protein